MPAELTQEQVSAFARSEFAAKDVPYPAGGDAKYRGLYGQCLTVKGQELYPYGGSPLYSYCNQVLASAVLTDVAAWKPSAPPSPPASPKKPLARMFRVAGPPGAPIEPPNGIFDQTEVATYALAMYAFYGVPSSSATAAHYQALYAQCLQKNAGPSFNAAANNAALYNQCNAALQSAVLSDIAAYRKAHPPPSPPMKHISQPLANARRSAGVMGMVGGMRALRGQVGLDPNAAQQPAQPLLGANQTPNPLPFVIQSGSALANPPGGNVNASPGGVLASPVGGNAVQPPSPAPTPSPYTTPILAGALGLAVVGIFYAYGT